MVAAIAQFLHLVSPFLETVCRNDALSKLYISDTIEVSTMNFTGMKGLDADHIRWVLQYGSLINFLNYHGFLVSKCK